MCDLLERQAMHLFSGNLVSMPPYCKQLARSRKSCINCPRSPKLSPGLILGHVIHERGSQITKHAHELSWCHGRLQQVFSCPLRACNQKTFGLKFTCDGLGCFILSPYLQVDMDELPALFDWCQLPQGCCWSRSRGICCQRKMRNFAYTPWRTPWRRSSVARHQCDGTVAPLSKNLVDRTVQAHPGSTLLPPGLLWTYWPPKSETWALRRALVAQREDDGGHDGVSLNRFNLIPSHWLVIYQNHVEIVPWPSIKFATGSWRVCVLILPVYSGICFPLPVHYWCHGATKTAQRTPWTVPAADVWSRSQNGTQGGLDLEVSYATNSQSILHLQILLCFSIECFLLPAFRRSMRSWLRQSFVPSWCKKPKV